MMKQLLIIENNITPLKIYESVSPASKKKEFIMGGIFTEFDIVNRNERIYTAEKFLPCLNELNKELNNGTVYGEYDHPEVFDTSMAKISHRLREMVYNKKDNRIDGKIQLLDTYYGKEAKALVSDECPIYVSSRAAGITEDGGKVAIKKLFTYDIVANPGFASAKMNCINESLGYKINEKTNFRIYETNNDSNINDLINMNSKMTNNKNGDFVTSVQLTEYSNYINKEIGSVKKTLTESIKSGKTDPKKIEELAEQFESLNATNIKLMEYLKYLTQKTNVVIKENNKLKKTTSYLIKHNDYLVDIVQDGISYTEKVAKSVNKNTDYSKYIAKTVDNVISYNEKMATKLNKSIEFANYLAENVDRGILYGEYIGEKLDKNIAHGDYIIENLTNTIAYSEHLYEHTLNINKYAQYLSENLDGNIDYTEYLAKNTEKIIGYAGIISEKLNRRKLNENIDDINPIPTLDEYGFDLDDEEDTDEFGVDTIVDETPTITGEPSIEEVPNVPTACDATDAEGNCIDDKPVTSNIINDITKSEFDEDEFSDLELSESIDKLIKESKKRSVVEKNDEHFLVFLNEAQINSYKKLSDSDKELVKIHMDKKTYFNSVDVLRLMKESLSIKDETVESKIVRLMPANVKPIWEKLNESGKQSIFSQAKLGYDLTTDSNIEYFWSTRMFNEKVDNKKLVAHDAYVDNDVLSNDDVNAIMAKFRSL